MSIHAPYNFVPLANTVHQPDWADAVSHDLPFSDGLSGTIDYTLTATSPLLVGGKQQPATETTPGCVTFFELPNNQGYAIPGSSLKGMLRNVTEIATFSRMNHVEDRRYGLRDISGKFVQDAYIGKVRNKMATGFIHLAPNGEIMLTPCKMVRLGHPEIEQRFHLTELCFKGGDSVAKKYEKWHSLTQKYNLAPLELPFSYDGENVTVIGEGDQVGYPVFTGQVTARSAAIKPIPKNGNKKYKDFLFYDADEEKPFKVEASAWGDFLFIHSDPYAGKKKDKMPWDDYWKNQFYSGKKVPVFYLKESGLLRFGLAYMPKLAGDFSIRDMIGHSSAQHLDNSVTDMATLLFGHADDTEAGALRGRIAFLPARHNSSEKTERHGPTILNSPKASYFPNYIKQATGDGSRLSGSSYATYLATSTNTHPEIRGWKRYPGRPLEMVRVQPLTDEQIKNTKTQITLEPLPKGTCFDGKIHFHNLKPEELGALLWSMLWGGRENLHHSLGMGKSFGFGQCQLRIGHLQIILNDPSRQLASEASSAKHFIDIFTRYMKQTTDNTWQDTIQIRALLGMADPEKASNYPGGLTHMRLSTKGGNEFSDNKKEGLVLCPPSLLSISLDDKKTTDIWVGATLNWEAGCSKLTAHHENGEAIATREHDVVRNMENRIKERFKKKKNKITANITVESIGNCNIITAITLPDNQ